MLQVGVVYFLCCIKPAMSFHRFLTLSNKVLLHINIKGNVVFCFSFLRQVVILYIKGIEFDYCILISSASSCDKIKIIELFQVD